MMDISDGLVYIMSQRACSSVYALFMLTEDNYEQYVSAKSIPAVYAADQQRNSLGAGR